jgi:hypothetical protein
MQCKGHTSDKQQGRQAMKHTQTSAEHEDDLNMPYRGSKC